MPSRSGPAGGRLRAARLPSGVMEDARRGNAGNIRPVLQYPAFRGHLFKARASDSLKAPRDFARRRKRGLREPFLPALCKAHGRRRVLGGPRIRALPSARGPRSGHRFGRLRRAKRHLAAVEKLHAEIRPGAHRPGGPPARERRVPGLCCGVRLDHHVGRGAQLGRIRHERRIGQLLRQEHDRRVRAP